MKKIFLGALIGVASIGSTLAAECTYNFNANQTQIDAVSSGAVQFPNINGQKVSLTFQASNTNKLYVAASSAFGNNRISQSTKNVGDIALNQSNLIAYEMIVKAPNVVLSGNSIVTLFPAAFFGTKNGEHVLINMIANLNNIPAAPDQIISAWQITDRSNSQTLNEGAISNIDLSNGVRMGFYINQQTQQVGVILNGSNLGYVGTYSTKPTEGYFVASLGVQNIPSTSNIVGKEFSIELITDRTKLQNVYPTGTKDICGNTI
ncbi:hypothetical protein F993_01498 [Acinetobacter proteolyticus]|uniref:DUF4882 domain-containing protein n=1 Tax=Acinetobacter proteolyticus TaxID=1776741 RepID=A0ABN0JG22_9GAMM|nr:DUF4882 family protein [Acinetobacter proteolyticus]ENU24182.1 hypothetical protein F993_01498 [Acinetobacter proteolyticus]